MDEPPPMTLAWVKRITRSFMCFCGTVLQPQEPMPLVIFAKPAGQWKNGCQSEPPASMSRTLTDGSALKRLANTQPAEPPPVMM